MSRYMLVFCLGLTALLAEPTIAPERSQAGAQTRRPTAPTATWRVYYYDRVRANGGTRWRGPYTYGYYRNHANALRAFRYLNEFPNSRAYIERRN